jgi:hypothetical protein
MKMLARFLMNAVVLIIFSPLLVLMSVALGLCRAWDCLELWAYYNGDETARDRDRWKVL